MQTMQNKVVNDQPCEMDYKVDNWEFSPPH